MPVSQNRSHGPSYYEEGKRVGWVQKWEKKQILETQVFLPDGYYSLHFTDGETEAQSH